jgi:hypothetical protein
MVSHGDLLRLFAEGMEARGHAAVIHEDWIEHPQSGIGIYPRALERGVFPTFVKSVVVVTVDHPRFPSDGIVEYQHALADTHRQAILDGVNQWLQMDFVVLLDALRHQPEHCNRMEWQPPDGRSPELLRRVLFGPIGHLITQPERLPKDAEHPFCPCCLFTNTYKAFLTHAQAQDFFGIRFFVSRNEDGLVEADCRINGFDWEVGKRALCAYAEAWPQAGLEIRKQYVVLQSVTSSLA